MDTITLYQRINNASQEIQRLVNQLDSLGQEAAKAEAEYDKQMAITLVRLRNGEELDLYGIKIKDPPASTSERIAKGLCSEARYKATLADNALRACQTKLRATMAVLSGRQSQNKYLENEPE